MKGKVIEVVKNYVPSEKNEVIVQGKLAKRVLTELEAGKRYILNDLVLKYNKIFKHASMIRTKQNKTKEFRKENEAMLLTQNGQTHATISQAIFKSQTNLSRF